MAGSIGWLVAFFRRAEPREPAPAGWALALDAAVAVGAAALVVYEVVAWAATQALVFPASAVPSVYRDAVHAIAGKGGMMWAVLPPTHAPAAALIAAALTALPLAARRFYPITVWLVIAAAIMLIHLRPAYMPPVALGSALYAAYSAITHSRYRNLAIAVVAVVTLVVATALGHELPRFPVRLAAILAILPTAVAGVGIRVLRRRLADSAARLRRAAAEAAAATERALAAERARIASELHDVVTHNVSVMIVQAGAARKIMASSPADAEDALLAVEATGREAMTELRNLLGLLGPAALLPQPGLDELDALIGRVSAAGLPIELQVSGKPRPLSPGADLAAYRVVQEGLTNVLRHAGRAAAAVGVEWGEQLVITVSDNGGGSRSGGNGAPGRGLFGLRERLALYGGDLAAGPRPSGGWQVRAVMPTGTAI